MTFLLDQSSNGRACHCQPFPLWNCSWEDSEPRLPAQLLPIISLRMFLHFKERETLGNGFESVPILLNFMISFLWEANSSSFRYHDDDEAVAGNQSSISSNFCNGPVPHVRLSLCCLCWASIYSETVWAQPSLRTYVVP